MRTLKFIVDGQSLKPDPACDFEGLVPGTDGYVQARFSFSAEWDGYAKVVGFYSPLGAEYAPQPLSDGGSCLIPPDALQKRSFKLRVFGKRDAISIVTEKLEVVQNGGKL